MIPATYGKPLPAVACDPFLPGNFLEGGRSAVAGLALHALECGAFAHRMQKVR
jgi:hypothetical protein